MKENPRAPQKGKLNSAKLHFEFARVFTREAEKAGASRVHHHHHRRESWLAKEQKCSSSSSIVQSMDAIRARRTLVFHSSGKPGSKRFFVVMEQAQNE